MNDETYVISRTGLRPELCGLWDGPAWKGTDVISVDCFRPESSSHHPITQCKLLYDDRRIFGIFSVHDRFVRCIHTGFQDPVWEDSCVEFFVQPKPDHGYFNFEFNCGGALLSSYVTDPKRIDGKVTKAVPLSRDEGQIIEIFHSLPSIIDPKIIDECTWYLEFSIPFHLLERYVGSIDKSDEAGWRGNLYKCGNKTSHPHWASWAPLSERNFHAPWDFGRFQFSPAP
jgi:hypothetical protein